MKRLLILLALLPAVLSGQEVIKVGANDTIEYSGTLSGVIQVGKVYVSAFSLPAGLPTENLLGYWSYDYGINADSTIYLVDAENNPVDTIDIVGLDWDITNDSLGIPLKTAATLQWVGTCAVDTLFWGNTTKRSVYPTTVFPNVDYNNKTYFKVSAHRLNANLTELYPYRIKEIAVYSVAKTGADSTSLWGYFNVPDLPVNGIRYVAKSGGDNTTIVAAEAAASAGDTIYIKSGSYKEDDATRHGIRPIKAITWICTGNVVVTASAGSARVCDVSSSTTAVIKIRGMVIDAEATYASGIYNTTATNKTFDNCVIIRATTQEISHGNAAAPLMTMNNCVINTTVAQAVLAHNITLNECYIKSTNFYGVYSLNSTGTMTFSYCDYDCQSSVSGFYSRSNGNYIVKYSNFKITNALDQLFYAYDGQTGNYTLDGNTFTSSYYPSVALFNAGLTSIFSVDIKNNHFDLTNTSMNIPVLNLKDCDTIKITDNYFSSLTELNSPFILMESTNTDIAYVNIENNEMYGRQLEGYIVQIGHETTSARDNKIGNINIVGNKIIGNLYYDINSGGTTHGVFVGHEYVTKFSYNYCDGNTYAFVYKSTGGENQGYINGNVFKNNKYAIRLKGIKNVPIYNNTFYDNLNANKAIVFISSNTVADSAYGCKLKNNIIYSTSSDTTGAIVSIDSVSLENFESDYNVIYGPENTSLYVIDGVAKTWGQVQTIGYEEHGVNTNPSFTSFTQLWPVTPFTGVDLGATYDDGLDISTTWPSGVVTKQQGATWQIGAYVK